MQKERTRRSEKTRLTATFTRARYTGDHPHIKGTQGVYYYSIEQGTEVYRPDSEGKGEWYRVWRENLVDMDLED